MNTVIRALHRRHKVIKIVALMVILFLLVNIIPHSPMTEVYAGDITATISATYNPDPYYAQADEEDPMVMKSNMADAVTFGGVVPFELDPNNNITPKKLVLSYGNQVIYEYGANPATTIVELNSESELRLDLEWVSTNPADGFAADEFSIRVLSSGYSPKYNNAEVPLYAKNSENVDVLVGYTYLKDDGSTVYFCVRFLENARYFSNYSGSMDIGIKFSFGDNSNADLAFTEDGSGGRYPVKQDDVSGGADPNRAYFHLVKTDSITGSNKWLNEWDYSDLTGVGGMEFEVYTIDNGSNELVRFSQDSSSLYTQSTSGSRESVQTDANGKLTLSFSDVWLGKTYRIVEKNLPDRYYQGSHLDVTFAFEDGNNIKSPIYYQINNYPRIVRLTKTDTDGKVLPNVPFQLLDSNKNLISTLTGSNGQYTYGSGTTNVLTTNEQGIIEIWHLPAGTYYFREGEPPEGYRKLVEDTPFEIPAELPANGNPIIPVRVENERMEPQELVVLKLNSQTKNLINGATFVLEKAPDYRQELTGENGRFVFQLPVTNYAGIYTLTETVTPGGYVTPGTKEVRFEVGADYSIRLLDPVPSHISLDGSAIKVENDPEPEKEDTPDKLEVEKVDSKTKAPLAGATFELTRPDGTTQLLRTGASGKVTFDLVHPVKGSYTLTEIAPPNGYRSISPIVFTIDDEYKVIKASGDGHVTVNAGTSAILSITVENEVLDDSSSSDPGPSGSSDPGPSGSSDPGPSGSSDPGPSGSSDPGPSGSSDPGPSGSSDPGPSGSSDPGPSGSSDPGPSGSSDPGPSGSSDPGPSGSSDPGPSGSSDPGPSSGIRPIPSSGSNSDDGPSRRPDSGTDRIDRDRYVSRPTTEIADDPVPLTNIPDSQVPLTNIPDGQVPKGGTPIPSTGTGHSRFPAALSLTVLSGVIVLLCCRKKR